MPDSIGSATLSLEITYPSTGKLSYHITDGLNFSSDEEKRNYLRDTVKQLVFLSLTNGSTKGTINYSIDGNALRFAKEGNNDCEDLGYSGAITNIAVRE